MQTESTRSKSPLPATELVLAATRDFRQRHERRRRQAPRALIVGALTGLLAVAFRYTLVGLDQVRLQAIELAHKHVYGPVIILLWCMAGAGLAVFLVKRLAPETSGSGIPHVEAVLYGKRPMRWQRVIPVKFLGGALAIGTGMALGREGPTVQMGSAVGQAIGDLMSGTPRENQALLAAGAAAGLAAAFNAPLAGVVFVLEELQRDFAPGVFTPSFLASVTADVVTRGAMGQAPVLSVFVPAYPPLDALPVYCIVGILAGLLGVLFNRGLLTSIKGFSNLARWPAGTTGAAVGVLLAIVSWYSPAMLGDGHELILDVLHGSMPIRLLVEIFVLRYIMTMLSYGCGPPGGIFAPLLVLGATLGRGVGEFAASFVPEWQAHLASFAAVGMASYFTAIVRAPLTGIVLIIEMTGHYDLMLPLLVASLFAYLTAELMNDRPIYEALLQLDMMRSDEKAETNETLLIDLQLHHGAPFEGKKVKEIGLPHGCLLISLRRGVHDMVPNAETVLEAGDQITAVVSTEADDGVEVLRHGMQVGPGE